jgi:hypothetical protein
LKVVIKCVYEFVYNLLTCVGEEDEDKWRLKMMKIRLHGVVGYTPVICAHNCCYGVVMCAESHAISARPSP